jgi:hypothetical protein
VWRVGASWGWERAGRRFSPRGIGLASTVVMNTLRVVVGSAFVALLVAAVIVTS